MKKVIGALGVAVIVAVLATLHFWQELGEERRQATELAAHETAMISAPPPVAAAPELPVPAAPIAVTSPPPVAAAASIAVPPASPQGGAQAADSPMKGILEAMATPEGMDATRAMMRGMMAQMYPDIDQELGLAAQEKQKLFDLLADPGQDSAALMMGVPKDPAARQEMQRKMVESERAQEAKISALLGSKYPQWEDYQSTAQARQQVDQLRRTLSASENPLSEAQSTQLVAAFASAQRRTDKETREWSTSSAAINSANLMQETVQRAVASQERLVEAATPILDNAQMQRYKRQVDQQVTVLRATMSMLGAGEQP
jgi:hypothetical protein